MSKKREIKGNNFLVQGSILAIAAIVAKIIGLIYRVPLTNILGDAGNSYYSTTNEIYTIILMISSYSIPLAVSRMISERISKGEYKNASRVFYCAMHVAVISGSVMALLTYVLSGFITGRIMNIGLAKYGLQVISPAILVFAITGTFRGYFQGFGTMVPTAISQVIEQIVNAILSLICAGIMFGYGQKLAASSGDTLLGPAWGAAGGAFGTVGSVTVAMLFMMVMYSLNHRTFGKMVAEDTSRHRESYRQIYQVLILTILPIVLSAVIFNISSVIDQGVFNGVLKSQGYTEEQYATIWGVYVGKYRVLMNVALSLASSLGPAIVPSLTAALSRGDQKEINHHVDSAVRFTMIFSIPCAIGLAALGGPIVEMLFHPQTGVPLAAGIMQAGAPVIILFAFSSLTTSILQGMGRLRDPLIHNVIALVVEIGCAFFFTKVLVLNIYGILYANIVFAGLVGLLNIIAICRHLHYRQEILRTFIIPTLASMIMGFGAFLVYNLLHLLFGVTISTMLAIILAVVLYAVSLIALGGINAQEILLLPKGSYLLGIIRKMGFLRNE